MKVVTKYGDIVNVGPRGQDLAAAIVRLETGESSLDIEAGLFSLDLDVQKKARDAILHRAKLQSKVVKFNQKTFGSDSNEYIDVIN